jgi:hypothetical protein
MAPRSAPERDSSIQAAPEPDGFECRWTRLVESCVAGKIMPFVGAGISVDAPLDVGLALAGSPAIMPRTADLTARMLDRLGQLPLHDQLNTWQRSELRRLTEIREAHEHKKVPPPSLADAAQLYTDVRGEQALFEDDGPLPMRLFRSVEPTLAHQAIAWLAREGLFTEVITTNYDCALEKAYARTFPPPPAAYYKDTWALVKHARDNLGCLRSVHDLAGYREHANQRQVTLPNHQPAYVLRVHKINGCAHPYAEGSPARPDGFLVITDRHLQSFDARHWANDLFRDRFRCRQIVFTGFGAEEPQVRFTALRVIEEFARPAATPSPNASTTPQHPHCYIHVFGDTLTSPQLQIAKAATSSSDEKSSMPLSAVFTKRDLPHFSTACPHGLDSNAFWLELYLSVAPRLIARRLERCQAHAALREHDQRHPSSRRIAQELRARLFGPDKLSASEDWLRPMLVPRVGQQPPLMSWVEAMNRESGVPACPAASFYEEFDRYDSLSLLLLHVLHLLGLDADSVHLDPAAAGVWLLVPHPDAFHLSRGATRVIPARWVLLCHQVPSDELPAPPAAPRSDVLVGSEVTCLVVKGDVLPWSDPVSLTAGKSTTWSFQTLRDLIAGASQAPLSTETKRRFRKALFAADPSPVRESPFASPFAIF